MWLALISGTLGAVLGSGVTLIAPWLAVRVGRRQQLREELGKLRADSRVPIEALEGAIIALYSDLAVTEIDEFRTRAELSRYDLCNHRMTYWSPKYEQLLKPSVAAYNESLLEAWGRFRAVESRRQLLAGAARSSYDQVSRAELSVIVADLRTKRQRVKNQIVALL